MDKTIDKTKNKYSMENVLETAVADKNDQVNFFQGLL